MYKSSRPTLSSPNQLLGALDLAFQTKGKEHKYNCITTSQQAAIAERTSVIVLKGRGTLKEMDKLKEMLIKTRGHMLEPNLEDSFKNTLYIQEAK